MVNVIYKQRLRMPSARAIWLDEELDNVHANFAIIPDELLDGILATGGWCELELSKDGKTVVGFTPTEPPKYSDTEATADDVLNALLGVSE